MERTVIYAKLQTEFFTTGVGNLGVTLGDPQKHRDMRMTWAPTEGLRVKYKGVEFLVPHGNIVGVTLAPETSSSR